MNPFLSLIIFIPLLAALLLSVACLVLFFEKGPSLDIAMGFFLTSGLCVYLTFLFKKTWKQKGEFLEVPGLENADIEQKKSLTNLYLVSTYLGLTLFGMVFFGYELMKGFFGALGSFMGLFLIWSSIVVRRLKNQVTETSEFHLNRAMYPRNKNVYLAFVVFLGIFLFLSYQFVPSWHFISPWDIGGILFFLASACVWLFSLDKVGGR